eukprot:TRINITY_DN6208_c0_g1_i5.p1 TRINITY_DN6208_c0_g1~~TRINITY_DN6208_c0_g1_i5.p1  ORF type:complete len:770 (-),score=162.28 TRINITY_DN6208_c0_g1_i5:97-2406(-)
MFHGIEPQPLAFGEEEPLRNVEVRIGIHNRPEFMQVHVDEEKKENEEELWNNSLRGINFHANRLRYVDLSIDRRNDFVQRSLLGELTREEKSVLRSRLLLDGVSRCGESNLTVCVPFYNEEKGDMERTLDSLRIALNELISNSSVIRSASIVLVGDGIQHLSGSMKTYLATSLNVQPDDLNPPANVDFRIIHQNGVRFAERISLSLLVKRCNGGKAHSQEMFCALFAASLESKYMFLTDCGTSYKGDCLEWLLRLMEKNPFCIGCTGHQRILPLEKQGLKNSWFNMLMAYSQGLDYEASQHVFSLPFSAVGNLPVIPGPCGIYNFKLLQENRALAEYFRILRDSKESKDPDFVKSNLILAEDRILCFLAVSNSNFKCFTAIEPRAVFYFESENDPEKFFQQRRRWLNGTVAGYIWMLQELNKRSMYDSPRVHMLRILVLVQIVLHFMMLLSPAIFTLGLHFSLMQLFSQTSTDYKGASLFFFVLVQMLFVHNHWKKRKSKLDMNITGAIMLCNAVVSLLIFAAYIQYLVQDFPKFVDLCGSGVSLIHNMQFWIMIGKLLPLSWMGLSLVLAMAHGWRSASLCVYYFLFYIPMLPTMVSTLPLYALCRTWELSWGNRPNVEAADRDATDVLHFAAQAFDVGRYSEALSEIETLQRIGINRRTLSQSELDVVRDYKEKVVVAKKLQDESNFLTFLVVVLNIILGLLLMSMESWQSVLAVLASLIFFPIVIFQVLALLYTAFFFVFHRGCFLVALKRGFFPRSYRYISLPAF